MNRWFLALVLLLLVTAAFWPHRRADVGGIAHTNVTGDFRKVVLLLEDKLVGSPDPAPFQALRNVSVVNTVEYRRPKLVFLGPNVSLYDLIGMAPANAAALCELFLLGHPYCHMDEGRETYRECILRYGVSAWTMALQPQCTRSAFWKSVVEELSPLDNKSFVPRFHELYDAVMKSHLLHPADWAESHLPTANKEEHQSRRSDSRAPVHQVPDQGETPAQSSAFHEPLNCSYGPVYPIGFCAPMFSTAPSRAEHKIWEWFPILPSYVPYHETKKIAKVLGWRNRYVTNVEDEFVLWMMYRYSYFAWTHARMGTDCQRHYEILAAGCVPLFPDLRGLPPHRVSQLPRSTLLEVFSLPGVDHIGEIGVQEGRIRTEFYYRTFAKQMNFVKLGNIRWDRFDAARYHTIAESLFSFTKAHLQCHRVAAYILSTLRQLHPRQRNARGRVLVIGWPFIDYQAVAVEQGLYELGVPYTVSGPGEHHRVISETGTPNRSTLLTGEAYETWRRQEKLANMYGLGFLVSRRIPISREAVLDGTDATLCRAVGEYRFDTILYTRPLSVSTTLPCEALVATQVLHGNVSAAVIDGDDKPMTSRYPSLIRQGYVVFSREAAC